MRISDWGSDVCSSDLQFTVCTYSIPKGSLEWWIEHLDKNGIPTGKPGVRFGQRFVGFEHPDCGIEFEVLEDEHDTREPYASPYVPIEHAQRGFHSWTASVRELEDMDFFMNNCWNFEKIGEEGNRHRYRVKGTKDSGTVIDIVHEPDRRQGSWTIAEGIIHHGAFAVPDLRSEEHTSELQSLMRISYAVFCLKKKKHTSYKHT